MKVTPKFNIGDSVGNVFDDEIGVITSFSYDPRNESFRYQVTSKEVDLNAKEVLHGFKSLAEDEIKDSKKESDHNTEDHLFALPPEGEDDSKAKKDSNEE